MARNKLIDSAFDKVYEQLPEYSFGEILYSLMNEMGIRGTGVLLEKTTEDFYEALFSLIRNAKEDMFSDEELDEINNNKIKFNAVKRWKRQ